MRSLTILYVEDYKLLLLYVKDMLEEQGWQMEPHVKLEQMSF